MLRFLHSFGDAPHGEMKGTSLWSGMHPSRNPLGIQSSVAKHRRQTPGVCESPENSSRQTLKFVLVDSQLGQDCVEQPTTYFG